MADIEEHLNVTIQQIEPNMQVPSDEFDGKVVYGQKRQAQGTNYATHTAQMEPVVKQLAKLESEAQVLYLKRHLAKRARS